MKQKMSEQLNHEANHQSPDWPLSAANVQVAEHLSKNSMKFVDVQPRHENGLRIGIAMNSSERSDYNDHYAGLMREFVVGADDRPEATANVMNMFYNMIRVDAVKNSHTFERPTTYAMDDRGNLMWSANDKPEATGLVLVRKDGTMEHLGTDEATRVGVINDISPEDKLYLTTNKIIEGIKEIGIPASAAFEDIISHKDAYKNNIDLVCVSFDGIVDNAGDNPDAAADQSDVTDAKKPADRMTRNAMKRKERAARKAAEEEQAKAAANSALPDDDLTRAFAANIQSQLDAMNAPPVSGPTETIRTEAEKAEIAERKRISDRVEKYSQKVASYEEIAAEALGRRMKGRLFNPLTNAKKEKARQDDLNMHLLEGFSRALDGALMKQWLAQGYSDDEAAQKVYEHQQTRQEARAARNHEELRKDKLGSFLDMYANMSKGKKVGLAIGATAVFGVASVGLAAAGGALAVAGGIGLAGAKVGKTYLQQRSKIYETGRDESMRSPDTLVSVENGHATKRTAAEQVFAGMAHDEKKREKAIQKSDRNKKVAAGLAAISAVAIGAGVAMKVAEHADDIQRFLSQPLNPNEIGLADGDWVTEAPASAPTPEPGPNPVPAPETIFSADASTVVNGEGWYQTIQEITGVTDPAQQAAILQKIGPALQEKGWAYPMNDGTWGISRPGTLPKDVLELIKNSR